MEWFLGCVMYVLSTAYLFREWQRFEPTWVPLDAAAAIVSLGWLWIGVLI